MLDAQVRSLTTLPIGPEGAPVQLAIPPDEPNGVYVAADMLARGKDGLQAAHGLTWLDVDKGSKRLGVQLDLPESAAASGDLPVTVTLSNTDGKPGWALIIGEPAEAPLLPDPVGYFLGRQPLQIGRAETYSQLIGGHLAGLASDLETIMPTGTAPIIVWSGPLPLATENPGPIQLHLPAYTGQLRLSVIAWSENRLGGAQRTLSITKASATAPKAKAAPKNLLPTMKAIELAPNTSLPVRKGQYLIIGPHPILTGEKC